jgi:outer membrane protein assembly factor BamB
MIANIPFHHRVCRLLVLAVTASLAACAGGSNAPKPAELPPNPALLAAKQAWVARVGAGDSALVPKVVGNTVIVAGADGSLLALDGQTGRQEWRANIAGGIAAGVGSDGQYSAVVTPGNELVTLEAGRELWRAKLPAKGFTAPLVAGARVFVLTADRAITAFDAQNGQRLWGQSRPAEPLVLNAPGVMLAVGDTLVVGQSGRLVGLNPSGGSPRWEAAVATPRGVNDVERLVDLVGKVSRAGETVCVRAFQSHVGCVNAVRGGLVWSKAANGATGVDGDDRLVYGAELDGKVMAWQRSNGERAWVNERLQFRGLTAPLALGQSVAVGDATGLLHFLSREDGSFLTRLPTDGSAIVASPVLAGGSVVVVTKAGGIYGFRPE